MAALSGAALNLALPPYGWWPLGIAMAALFATVANARSGRRAFYLGAAFAVPLFTLHILWLPQSFADLLGPAFWALFPLLIAILALFIGLTTWLSWLVSGGGGRRTLLILPAAWVLVEWARTQGYFAFPWGTLGYQWLDTPVAQLADLGGVYGLSLLVTVPAALLALPLTAARGGALVGRRLALVGSLTGVLLVSAAFPLGDYREQLAQALEPAEQRLSALLVQANLDALGRLTTARGELNAHLELTRTATAEAALSGGEPFDLVVWPEGAVIGLLLEGAGAEELLASIAAAAPESAFIVGGRSIRGGRSYNSAYSIANATVIGRYDKFYLVPFGERWPFIDQLEGVYAAVFGALGLPLLASTYGGEALHPLSTPLGASATFICYESVFPQVQRKMVADGARFLVLVTNDAWFAFGAGGRQHFDMGRLRAIESRRWLLRAGNDGITAAVDPYGNVTAELERRVAGALPVSFGQRDDITPWVRYGPALAPLLASYLAVMGGLLLLASARSGGARQNRTAVDRLRRS